jgi:hypothetical protein
MPVADDAFVPQVLDCSYATVEEIRDVVRIYY